jgi:hypothetical protein
MGAGASDIDDAFPGGAVFDNTIPAGVHSFHGWRMGANENGGISNFKLQIAA